MTSNSHQYVKYVNKECYNECPQNTEDKNNNNVCFCSYNYFNDSNLLECFNETDNCTSEGYDYTNMETKECFNTKDECVERGYKVFNKECYNECPQNTIDKNNNSICLCQYNYFNDSNLLICFNEEVNCGTKGYDYSNMETKECFNTKEDCIERGYKVFNQGCHDECPQNTIDKNNSQICECLYYFYNNSGFLILLHLTRRQ